MLFTSQEKLLTEKLNKEELPVNERENYRSTNIIRVNTEITLPGQN
jgi:hypothetical protein